MGIVTVVTPAASANLTTLVKVKAEMQIASSSDDTALSTYIAQASALIEGLCDRVFGVTAYSELMQGNNAQMISLTNYPVTTLSEVSLDGVTLEASYYNVATNSGLLVNKYGVWPQRAFRTPGITQDPSAYASEYNLEVTYSAGYAVIPAEIEQCCLQVVKSLFNGQGQDMPVKSESINGYSVSYAAPTVGVSPEVEAVLNRWRRII